MELDRIDFEIIDALQNNGRLTNKELAAKVGLAPSSCLQRVKSLQRDNVLTGFHAEVAPGSMGIELQAFVAVRVFKHSREAFKSLYAHISKLPEVLSIFHISGVNDLQVHVAVRDIGHLRDLIVDEFASRKEVDRCETSVIFGFDRNPKLPNYRTESIREQSQKRSRPRKASLATNRLKRSSRNVVFQSDQV